MAPLQTGKVLGKVAGLLTALQLLRMGCKAIVFSLMERTVWADTLVSCCYMIAATAALLLVWRKRPLSLLPKHFGKGYLLATALAAAFLVSTPFITRNTGAGALLSLFYGAIVTVAFEELLFRGWAWKELETLRGGFFPWLGSSLFFGLWHLGYTDTVL